MLLNLVHFTCIGEGVILVDSYTANLPQDRCLHAKVAALLDSCKMHSPTGWVAIFDGVTWDIQPGTFELIQHKLKEMLCRSASN